MIYKYVSIKTVIAKVIADLDLAEENFRIADCLEWVSEALGKIGSFPQFIIRTTGRDDLPLLELVDHQVELPYDFHNLIQVSYSSGVNGPFYPMRYGTGSFESTPNEYQNTTNNSNLGTVLPDIAIIALAMQVYNLSYADALTKINTEPSTKAVLSTLLESSPSTAIGSGYSTTDCIYTIRGGYLKTNIETGFISITYQAIPTDNEGYPLIPDLDSFREALYWYINMKLLYPQWKTGQVRDAIYLDARRSWNYYCKQAYGEAMMPDRGQLESIKNSWLRLIPNISEVDTDFSHLGEQQIVYNHST
jgi:hypothetical protein